MVADMMSASKQLADILEYSLLHLPVMMMNRSRKRKWHCYNQYTDVLRRDDAGDGHMMSASAQSDNTWGCSLGALTGDVFIF